MTCREKLAKEHPHQVVDWCLGGCKGCPSDYGYAAAPSICHGGFCHECWGREVEDPWLGGDEHPTELPPIGEVVNWLDDAGKPFAGILVIDKPTCELVVQPLDPLSPTLSLPRRWKI